MQKFFRTILMLSVSALCLSGCAMDGYKSDYSCPQMQDGKCVSLETAMQEAYDRAHDDESKVSGARIESAYAPDPIEERAFLLNDVKNFDAVMLTYEKCLRDTPGKCDKEREAVTNYYNTAEDRGRAKEVHSTNMEERATKLAAMEKIASNTGVAPIRQPDAIMPITIMPYQTESGNLVSERTIWVVVQPGNWTWTTDIGDKKSGKPGLGETR